MKLTAKLRSFLLASSSLLAFTNAFAASAAWNVDSAGTWGTGANWTPAAAPGATSGTTNADTASFGIALTVARIVTVDANRNLQGINFTNLSGFGYTLSGGNILLTNAGLIQTSGAGTAHTDTISSAIELQGDAGTASFTAGSTQNARLLTIGGGVTGVSTIGNTTALTLNGANTGLNTVSGVIGNGAGGGNLRIVKSAAGLWSLTANNTFTGGITVNAGTLRLGATQSFTGGVILNGGALGDNTTNLTSAGLNGNAITVNGNASIGVSAATTFVASSTVNITAGLLTLATNNSFHTWNGAFTGAGGLVVGTLGLGGNTINLTSTGNTFTGGVDFTNSPNQAAALNVNSFADSATSGAGNIRFGLSNTNAQTHTFALGSGAIAPLTLANRQFNIAGTNVNAVINNNGGQAFTISSNTANAGTGAATRTLTLGGTGAGLSTFSGNITNGTIATLNVTKGGAATSNTWVLSGNNSFNGLLTLTGSTAASTTSVLTLSGNNIGMTGGVTINGNATAGVAGARLNINSATAIGTGTLTFGTSPSTIANTSGSAITLTTNNAMAWNQDFTFATGSDLNMGTGAVTLGGNRAITTGSTLTVGGVVSDGVSDFGITKGGGGGLTLTGDNSYSGKTSVSQGILTVNSIGNVSGGNSALGNPTTVPNGTINLGSTTLAATLRYTGTGTVTTDRVINLSGTTGAVALDMSGTGSLTFTSPFTALGVGVKTLTLTGSTAGTGEIQGAIVNSTSNTALAKTGTGTWTLSGLNTYSGGTSIPVNSGTLNITHGSALGTGLVTIVSNTATGVSSLTLNSATGITVANNFSTSGEGVGANGIIRNVTGNNVISGTFTLASGGGSTRIQSDGGSLTLSGTIAPNVTGRFLFLDGSATGEISGSINNGAGANVLAGVVKDGAGTWTLSSATNSHTGTTTINEGTLLINGNFSTAIGAVTVNGGTLGGSGTLGGAATVGAATLAPGTSPGTLTITNALSLASTSILAWELNAADQTVGSNINDLVTGVTNLTLDGTINVTSATLLTGTWRLFNYTGTLINNTLNLGTIDVGSGLTASIDTTTPFQVNLVVIPEPNVAALIGALGGILLLRRRR